MAILLLARDKDIIDRIKTFADRANTTLTLRRTYRGLTNLIKSMRPLVVINTLIGIQKDGESLSVVFPEEWQPNLDCLYYDFGMQTMQDSMFDSIDRFLDSVPDRFMSDVSGSPSTTIRGGVLRYRAKSAKSGRSINEAQEITISAVRSAQEAFQGVVSYDQEVIAGDNRIPVPISSEVLETVNAALFAALSLSASPLKTKPLVISLRSLNEFFKDLKKSIESLNKTLNSSIKTTGLVVILLTAISLLVEKLGVLIEELAKLAT